MITNYRSINLPNFQQTRSIISNQLTSMDLDESDGVYPYVTSLDVRTARCLDVHRWMQSIPPLEADLKLVGLFEKWVSSALVLTYNKIDIHRDHADEFDYSLNLPIANTKDTFTCFYTTEHPPVTRYLPNGLPYDAYNEDSCQLIDKVEIMEPTLLNVKIPHGVTLNGGPIPRITIALRMSHV